MTTIKLRRGTAAQWTAANPVLAVGEPGFETDSGRHKIGDGTTAWAELPGFIDEIAMSAAFAPGIQVTSKGAVGDGATDDTTAFADTIAAAVAIGAEIYVPQGTYIINTLAITSPVTIRLGPGATVKHKNAATNHLIHATANLNIYGPGTIDGNHANQTPRKYAISAPCPTGRKVVIDQVRFVNTQAAAIYSNTFGGELDVTNCHFSGMDEHSGVPGEWTAAVYVESGETGARGQFRFNHNTLIGTDAPAIAGGSPGGIFFAPTLDYPNGVGNFSTLEAIGNHFWGIGQNAGGNDIGPIHTYPATDGARVVGNYFEKSGFCAIAAKSVRDFVCTGNVILNGQTSAQNIASEGAISYAPGLHSGSVQRPRAVITGNIIDTPGGESATLLQDGIAVIGTSTSRATDVVIANNVVTGTGTGIRSDRADNIRVSGNVVNGSTGGTAGTQHGIRFDNCSGMVMVSGNEVTTPNGSGLYGLTGLSAGRFLVSGNFFTHTAAGFTAVVLRGGAVEKFTGNVINATAGTALSVAGDGTNNVGYFYWDLSNTILAGTKSINFAQITKAAGHLSYPNSPDALVVADPGTLYTREAITGGARQLYVKDTGTGTTGWRGVGTREATTAQLDSAADTVNTTGKYEGMAAFNTVTNKPVWATGNGPTSTWVDATGATAHTPV